MTKVVKAALFTLLFSTCLFTAGCAAVKQWWEDFKANPVAQIQAFEHEVQTVLTILNGAWSFIQPFIPASALPLAQQQYANGVSSVGHAEAVLQDTVTAAVAAKQTPLPDFTSLTVAVSDAISQIIAIVDTYKNGAPVAVPDAGPVMGRMLMPLAQTPGLEEARARNAHLRTYRIEVQ